jgi:serine/threonine protein kinase
VLRDRAILARFAAPTLLGSHVDVSWESDKRRYELLELAGEGQTGVAWRARDNVGLQFALKFVLQSEYESHSLDAETRRANAIQSSLIAKINFFGQPEFHPKLPDADSLYAIAVEWIDGVSLRSFLADSSTTVSPQVYIQFARDLCEVLQSLKDLELCHGDLHDENILVRREADALAVR